MSTSDNFNIVANNKMPAGTTLMLNQAGSNSNKLVIHTADSPRCSRLEDHRLYAAIGEPCPCMGPKGLKMGWCITQKLSAGIVCVHGKIK